MQHFFRKIFIYLKHENRILVTTLASLLLFSFATYAFASFFPGETLNPNCLPTDPTCSVNYFPDQTSNAGKFLTTDGTSTSWSAVSGGIGSLNGLTDTAQTFATGTAGTDFGISSASGVHTFNIPSASATNRGLVTSADWSAFNSKLTSALASGDIFVGNGSGVATNVGLSGDATLSNTGALTIGSNAITTGKIINAAVTYAKLQNESALSLLGNPTGSSASPSEITLGSGFSFSGTTLTVTGAGGGTVTLFSSGTLSPLFTTSVATSTTTPALSFSLSNAGAETIFGNNSGSPAAPVYFTPTLASALFANQGTANTILHGNASGNPSWSAVSLTADVSGILPVANGGTGSGTAPYVTNTTDATLTQSGSGPYTLGLNLGNANTWSAVQTYGSGDLVSPTVIGGTGSGSTLTFQSTTGNQTSGTAFSWHGGNNGGTTLETILYNGNFGVGTTNPAGKLTIGVSPVASANYGTLSLGGGAFDGSTSGFFAGSSSGTSLAINEASGYGGNLLDLQTAGVSKFSVTGNGNVGIGMAAGTQTLGVKYNSNASSGITLNNMFTSASGPTMTFYSANSAKFQFTTEAAWQGAGSDQTMVLGAESGGMYFYTNNSSTSAMYINSAGKIGIGTTSPNYPLDVQATVSTSVSGAYGFLNSSTPTGTGSGTGTANFSINAAGRIVATEFDATSDERLKTLVAPIDPSKALAVVAALNPVDYQWNALSQNPDASVKAGFFAQQVQTVIPEAVSIFPGVLPDQYHLDYSQITPYLAAAIQELNIKIAPLTSIDPTANGSLASLVATYVENSANGITDFFANRVHTQELCLRDSSGSETCITKSQLDQLLQNAGVQNQNANANVGTSSTPAQNGSAATGAQSSAVNSPASVSASITSATTTSTDTTTSTATTSNSSTTTSSTDTADSTTNATSGASAANSPAAAVTSDNSASTTSMTSSTTTGTSSAVVPLVSADTSSADGSADTSAVPASTGAAPSGQ